MTRHLLVIIGVTVNHLSPTSEINNFLTVLAPDKVSGWSMEDIRKFLVGLQSVLEINYSQDARIQLRLLDDLVQTCTSLRDFLNNSGTDQVEQAQKNLSKIITILHRLFLTNYSISASEIDELRFNEKAYELLIELGVVPSQYPASQGYYGRSHQDRETEKLARRAELLEFATNNIERIIKTSYNWGSNGRPWNSKITEDQKIRIRIYESLKKAQS